MTINSDLDFIVMVIRAYRTAICKAKRGGFKDTLPDDLLASVLKVNPLTMCLDFMV